MKKLFILSLTAIALAACSDEDFLGNNAEKETESVSTPIAFGFNLPNSSRATATGADAAAKLNNHFVVYGTKHVVAEDSSATNDDAVYTNFQVKYKQNTAGTTASNTNDWEYVGLQGYDAVPANQGVKYWDYSAKNGYTFTAFSSKDISYPAAESDLVKVTKVTEGKTIYDKGYTVSIKEGANLDSLYYSDRTVVGKSDFGKPVTLTFRNFASRIRVGFYETVPGYDVKIDSFYFDDNATVPVTTFKAMDKVSTTAFKAALQNVKKDAESNIMTVAYYDSTFAENENQPTVATNTTVTYNYDLTLGSGITAATKLAETSAAPTWDNDGNYTTVYPFEANTNPMLIRVDYTLTANDGTNDKIVVKNARVVVPVQYVQWKSNYAYTYLFKISNNSNGTTGDMPDDPDDPDDDDDPEGLHPITFDALSVSADDHLQETITSVATNNITTYSKSAIGNEYTVGSDIYVVNNDTKTHEIVRATAIGDATGNAQVYKVTTEGDAISEASVLSYLTGAKNGLTLTAVSPAAQFVSAVPSNDGSTSDVGEKGAVLFTPATSGIYVYVYTGTKYVPTTYAAAGDTYDATTTYYFRTDKGVYFAASGVASNNYTRYKTQLYVKTADGTPGVYDVKVIVIGE